MLIRKFTLPAIFAAVFALAHPAFGQSTQRFASVYKITGTVLATNKAASTERTLSQGDAVFVGEQVRAGPSAEAVLRTDDAGVIAVRPNAAFVMEQFKADGDASDNLTVRILSGALRMVTGWTGYFNKDKHRIITPSATVGIRGTDHEPYVMSAEMAVELQMPEGTYNKVNHGGTVLRANGVDLEVTPGRVGFAPAPQGRRARALMTALAPTLLEKVPGFFIAGAFDGEIEDLAAQDLAQAMQTRKLDQPPDAPHHAQRESANVPLNVPVTVPVNVPVVTSLPEAGGEADNCNPAGIAADWLRELDAAVQNRDAPAFLAKFDPKAVVTARVRDGSGNLVQLGFSREEVVKSTFSAFAQLSDYASRRPVTTAQLVPGTRVAQCDNMDVESVAIESGRRNGASYRSESLETYRLVRRAGKWLATQASTSQR